DVPAEGPVQVFKKDDFPDLVCHFATQQVAWPRAGGNCGVVRLAGSLKDGAPISGIDSACLAGETSCSTGAPLPIDILPTYFLTFSEQSLCFVISGPGTTAGPAPITVSSTV